MNINSLKRRVRQKQTRRLNLEPTQAVVCDYLGNIYDPRDTNKILVRVVASDGSLSLPTSVLPPSKFIPLQPGSNVYLERDKRDQLYIADMNVAAEIASGNNTAMLTQNKATTTQDNIETLRLVPSNPPSLTVKVKAWNPVIDGIYYEFLGAKTDLTVPTNPGDMYFACIFVLNDLTGLEVFYSTPRPEGDIALGVLDVRECISQRSSGSFPVAAVKLVNGQTAVTLLDIQVDGRALQQLINAFDTIYNQIVQKNGVDQPQEKKINLIEGTGITLTFADNPADGSTDITIASTGGSPSSFVFKKAVAAVAVANVNIAAPGAALDSYTLVSGDRILLTAQSTASQNGLWVWTGAAAALTRPTDYPSGSTTLAFQYITLEVINGTVYTGTRWRMTTAGAITIDTTSQAWAKVITGVSSGGTGADLSATGGSSQFVKQSGVGAALTVGTIADADLPTTMSGKTFVSPVFNTGVSGSAVDNDPTLAANSATKLATQQAVKAYADAISQGLYYKQSVRVATIAALPSVTYANGTAGVGATLTASATGVLTVDGVALALGDRLWIKDQAAQLQNGLYKVTVAGAVGVAFVLTRTTDGDTSDELIGATAFVREGTVNIDQVFATIGSGPYTIGTTAIVISQISGVGDIAVTAPITKSGNNIGFNNASPGDFGATTPGKGWFSELKVKVGGVFANITHAFTADRIVTLPGDADVILVGVATAQTLTNKTLTIPTIADFTNAQHGHGNAATGGQLNPAVVFSSGFVPLVNGGTGVDLSASGGATSFLAQNASHVVSARAIANADLPTVDVPHGGTGATSLAGHGSVLMNSAGTAQTSLAPGTARNVQISDGTDWLSRALVDDDVPADPSIIGGRLTFAANDPLPAADLTGQTTVRYTWYTGDKISVRNAADTKWIKSTIPISDTTASISGGGSFANRLYDSFGYDSSGTLAMELSPWDSSPVTGTVTGATNPAFPSPIVLTMSTGDVAKLTTGDYVAISGMVGQTGANNAEWQVTKLSTTTVQIDGSLGNGAWSSGGTFIRIPTTSQNTLTLVNGRLVKSSDHTRAFLGTLSTGFTAGQSSDAVGARLLSNAYNQVPRDLYLNDATSSWTTNNASTASVMLNNSPTNRVRFVTAVQGKPVKARGHIRGNTTANSGTGARVGLVMDIANALQQTGKSNQSLILTNSALVITGNMTPQFEDRPVPGLHFIQWTQASIGAQSTTIVGGIEMGLFGEVYN